MFNEAVVPQTILQWFWSTVYSFSVICTFPHYNWLLFTKWWVAFSFLYVYRILLVREAFLFLFLKKVLLPYWHSIPCCHPHCYLFWVSGLLWLSKYLQPHMHSFWMTSAWVSPYVHVHLAFCLQFRQKSQKGLQLTKGKYLYLLGRFIHRLQLRCILSKIIFKLKQHSKYLI